MVLVALGGLSLPMFCWCIARSKGRKGSTWITIAGLAICILPACGGLLALIVAALMPKVGEPMVGPNDKKVLYSAIGCFIAGVVGFAMLVPAIMTIVNALK